MFYLTMIQTSSFALILFIQQSYIHLWT